VNKLEIYKKITEVNEKHQEHLKRYKDDLENLAENNESMVFMSGYCEECESYDKQILELEKLLKA
jgi:hypothetical protein